MYWWLEMKLQNLIKKAVKHGIKEHHNCHVVCWGVDRFLKTLDIPDEQKRQIRATALSFIGYELLDGYTPTMVFEEAEKSGAVIDGERIAETAYDKLNYTFSFFQSTNLIERLEVAERFGANISLKGKSVEELFEDLLTDDRYHGGTDGSVSCFDKLVKWGARIDLEAVVNNGKEHIEQGLPWYIDMIEWSKKQGADVDLQSYVEMGYELFNRENLDSLYIHLNILEMLETLENLGAKIDVARIPIDKVLIVCYDRLGRNDNEDAFNTLKKMYEFLDIEPDFETLFSIAEQTVKQGRHYFTPEDYCVFYGSLMLDKIEKFGEECKMPVQAKYGKKIKELKDLMKQNMEKIDVADLGDFRYITFFGLSDPRYELAKEMAFVNTSAYDYKPTF